MHFSLVTAAILLSTLVGCGGTTAPASSHDSQRSVDASTGGAGGSGGTGGDGTTEAAKGLGVGVGFACVEMADGSARCWGSNASGQLGDGTHVDSSKPVAVTGLSGVAQISAGWDHSCALTGDGTAWCWGSNVAGGVGNGTESAPYPGCSPNCGVPAPQAVGLNNLVAVAAGALASCAIRGDGTVWCWGWNLWGTLGNGSLVDSPTPTQVEGVTDAVQITMGSHACALLKGGRIMCWGQDEAGEVGNGTVSDSSPTPAYVTGITDAVQVAAGHYDTCAVRADGSVWCWGIDPDHPYNGDPGGVMSSVPVQVAGISNAVRVALGDMVACVVDAGGGVTCWGSPGGNSPDPLPDLVPVAGVAGAVDISVGGQDACARLVDGSVWCWNSSISISGNPLGDSATPTQVNLVGATASP